jgi:hypothetical protein
VETFGEELRASKQPFVQLKMSEPMDLLTDTFKWKAATILACELLGINRFVRRGSAGHRSNVPGQHIRPGQLASIHGQDEERTKMHRGVTRK